MCALLSISEHSFTLRRKVIHLQVTYMHKRPIYYNPPIATCVYLALQFASIRCNLHLPIGVICVRISILFIKFITNYMVLFTCRM